MAVMQGLEIALHVLRNCAAHAAVQESLEPKQQTLTIMRFWWNANHTTQANSASGHSYGEEQNYRSCIDKVRVLTSWTRYCQTTANDMTASHLHKISNNRWRRPSSQPLRPFVSLPSPEQLYQEGKNLRSKCPRQGHAFWRAHRDRPDPISLLEKSNKGRLPELIPIRYGRMMRTPFTFYRGAALNMADDLAKTPVTGWHVQACGDSHLLNFGFFATPERREIFDINDLDETLPAPWEWDVKRLAASFVLACRSNGFNEPRARDAALACVRSYRQRIAEFSRERVLDRWYAHIEIESLIPRIRDGQSRKRIEKRLATARQRDVLEHDFPKLTEVVGELPMIKDNPPLIYHWQEGQDGFLGGVLAAFAEYRQTLEEDRRVLLNHYQIRDIAMKVVGVGSVGTWCGIALLLAGARDPLFLQIKEARASVLELYAGKSIFPNHGQRVVNGYRMMQSASDLFLGWAVGPADRHFYVRQLNDVKIKVMVELFTPSVMMQYAELCGWTLAMAHARSGEPERISGYLGKSEGFDEAVADFSVAYADQSERDHKLLVKAVREGRIEVEE